MITLLISTILVALATRFTVLVLDKFNLIDLGILKGPKLLAKVLGCQFCTCVQIALILSIIFVVLTGKFILITCFIFAIPITRQLQ